MYTRTTFRKVAGLEIRDKRTLLKAVRNAQMDDGANMFFPAHGLFGCDVVVGHVLTPTISAPYDGLAAKIFAKK